MRVRPEIPPLPKASDAPLPISVAVFVDNPFPPIRGGGMGSGTVAQRSSSVNLGAILVNALRNVRLFEDVRYFPTSPTIDSLQSADLALNAAFERSFSGDPHSFGKLLWSSFLGFVPMCCIQFHNVHSASGRLTLSDMKTGALIREYAERSDMTISWKFLGEIRSYEEGPEIAAKALVARMMDAMAGDRALFLKIAKERVRRPVEKTKPFEGSDSMKSGPRRYP